MDLERPLPPPQAAIWNLLGGTGREALHACCQEVRALWAALLRPGFVPPMRFGSRAGSQYWPAFPLPAVRGSYFPCRPIFAVTTRTPDLSPSSLVGPGSWVLGLRSLLTSLLPSRTRPLKGPPCGCLDFQMTHSLRVPGRTPLRPPLPLSMLPTLRDGLGILPLPITLLFLMIGRLQMAVLLWLIVLIGVSPPWITWGWRSLRPTLSPLRVASVQARPSWTSPPWPLLRVKLRYVPFVPGLLPSTGTLTPTFIQIVCSPSSLMRSRRRFLCAKEGALPPSSRMLPGSLMGIVCGFAAGRPLFGSTSVMLASLHCWCCSTFGAGSSIGGVRLGSASFAPRPAAVHPG